MIQSGGGLHWHVPRGPVVYARACVSVCSVPRDRVPSCVGTRLARLGAPVPCGMSWHFPSLNLPFPGYGEGRAENVLAQD